ncbi:MAG: CAP domain-containing protein [Gemmataceae bacterium]
MDAINGERGKAGVEPIFLDAEKSRACQARAEDLARHAARLDDKALSAVARTESVASEAPVAAVEKWMKEPARRAAILESRLRTFGAGFARNVAGQWFSVFDWTCGIDRQPPMEAAPVTGAIAYPAPGQMRVPLWFPGNETPDPLPQTRDKLAGYPITLIFPPRTRLEDAAAQLSSKEEGDLAVWLSSPEKPANPQFARAQQSTICLIAKKPLRPNTLYHMQATATVNGAAWSARWDFTTVTTGEIHQEMAGAFLRLLNKQRRRAGLPPAPLDALRSKACADHALYLARNAPVTPSLNWNEEKADLPGYTAEGAEAARTASIQGGGGPVEAVTGLMDSIISRPQLLDSRLRGFGLGYTPFALGGWVWVINLHCEPRREADREYFYPAPDQDNVPLVYPPTEVPSPVPADNKGKLAGYAITVLFDPRTRLTAATAKLVDDKGSEMDGWFSTPEKPAIAGFPQRLLCLLPKKPLRPDMRYTATFQAEVNGRPWRRTWSFSTLKEPDRYADDLEDRIVARVNAVRKAAGLSTVRLDADLSRGCQAHARYLALNHQRSATLGLGVHREDADLPGASPQGAKAAKEAVIAVVLDPQTCVENWMATLYHRIPILTPNLERVGFGHARVHGHKWACVLDTGNGRTTPR